MAPSYPDFAGMMRRRAVEFGAEKFFVYII
jgi:hypothetical protein